MDFVIFANSAKLIAFCSILDQSRMHINTNQATVTQISLWTDTTDMRVFHVQGT